MRVIALFQKHQYFCNGSGASYGRSGARIADTKTNHKIRLRSNLSLNGKINENWNFAAKGVNLQDFKNEI